MATRAYQKRMAKSNIMAWRNSRYTDLRSAYGRYSKDKADAWDYCMKLCSEKNGEGLKVISANSWRFTAGFVYPDAETGELMFMYITKEYDQPVSLAITD